MQTNTLESKQHLSLDNRKIISLTGVLEVESSSDKIIKLNTNLGGLCIFGNHLTISDICVENGTFSASGSIDKLEYKSIKKRGFFSSLFH